MNRPTVILNTEIDNFTISCLSRTSHYNIFYGHSLFIIFNTHLFPDVLEDFNTFSDLFKASVYLTCTNKIINPWKHVQPTRTKVEEKWGFASNQPNSMHKRLFTNAGGGKDIVPVYICTASLPFTREPKLVSRKKEFNKGQQNQCTFLCVPLRLSSISCILAGKLVHCYQCQ